MMIKLLISFLLFQLSLAQTFLHNPLQCKNPRSKICLLQGVTLIGVEVPTFPDLAEKHSLIIRSGNIPDFNEHFTSQFGGVTKVTLGRLNIEYLHIPSNWVSLNAESNQIRKLIVESTDDNSSDGFVSDGPVDSKQGDKDESQTEKPADSKEGTKDESKTEKTAAPKEDEKEEYNTESPTDSTQSDKDALKTENPADSKKDSKEVLMPESLVNSKQGDKDVRKTENPADYKKVRIPEPPADSKQGDKDASKTGNPADSNKDSREVLMPESPVNSKQGEKDVSITDNPADSKEVRMPEPRAASKQGEDVSKTENLAYSKEDTIATTTTVEPLVGYRLESLNLANNKLRSIRELKCMVNLKELRLDGNELEFIEMATFDGMTKLRKLSLAKNKINHISSPQSMHLPSLEWFSLAFNRLATLQVSNWDMLQLLELDVSHNMLVKLDVDNFDQFVSLEKLAVANNSWTCYWLNEALKEISKRDFITLVNRDDDPGNCPNGLPVEGICCSLTVHDDEALNNENLQQRIQRFQKQQDQMGNDLKGKIGSFEHEWNGQWETLHRDLAEKRKRIEAREKEPKDESKVTEKDINDLNGLIEDCKSLLLNMESLRKDNAVIAQSYTQSFYTTISLKNKLLAAMRNAAKLKSDLHQYEISFKADVK